MYYRPQGPSTPDRPGCDVHAVGVEHPSPGPGGKDRDVEQRLHDGPLDVDGQIVPAAVDVEAGDLKHDRRDRDGSPGVAFGGSDTGEEVGFDTAEASGGERPGGEGGVRVVEPLA